jgi:hypothetical protein
MNEWSLKSNGIVVWYVALSTNDVVGGHFVGTKKTSVHKLHNQDSIILEIFLENV